MSTTWCSSLLEPHRPTIPNYTYLKLKMPGPNGIITVESTYEHAYDSDVECIEYAEAIVEAEALIADLDQLANEVPDQGPCANSWS